VIAEYVRKEKAREEILTGPFPCHLKWPFRAATAKSTPRVTQR
jgi:hypothetical protein